MKKNISEKAKKRILIAKDVLKFLSAKKILEKKENGYIIIRDAKIKSEEIKKPLEFLLKKTKQCEVCALGSLLYAHTMRFNKVKISDLNVDDPNEYRSLIEKSHEKMKITVNANSEQVTKPLKKYFTEIQLSRIEDAFEHTAASLEDIMEHIIENKGNFDPIKLENSL